MKSVRWLSVYVSLLCVASQFADIVCADDLTLTPSHRVWVTNRDGDGDGHLGDWIEAEDLRIGDRLLLADGSEAVLHATESAHRVVDSDGIHSNLQPSTLNLQPASTYNFEVAEAKSYFAGTLGVWVHNMCAEAGETRFYDPDLPHARIEVVETETSGFTFYHSVYTSDDMVDLVLALDRSKDTLWRQLVPDWIVALEPTWFNLLNSRRFERGMFIGNVSDPKEALFARLRRSKELAFEDSTYKLQQREESVLRAIQKMKSGSDELLVYNYSIFLELEGVFLDPRRQFSNLGPHRLQMSEVHRARLEYFAQLSDLFMRPNQPSSVKNIHVLEHGIPSFTEDAWYKFVR